MSGLELVQDTATLCSREKSCGWHLSGIKDITSCTVPPGFADSFVEHGFKGQRMAVPLKQRHTKIPHHFLQ